MPIHIEPNLNPTKNVKEAAHLERSLTNLPQSRAADINVPKIIELKAGQQKIAHFCSKVRMRVVIDLHDSNYRMFNGNIQEFDCQCGQVFHRPLQ